MIRPSQCCLLLILVFPSTAWPQAIPHHEIMNTELRKVEKGTWHIFGKVTDLNGEPLRAARVHVDIGYGSQYWRELTTDVRGEFRTEYALEATTFTSLSVNLTVEREGFRPAREFVDFGSGDKTWEIDIAMRPDAGQADDLPVATLVNSMASKMRAGAAKEAARAPAGKDFEQGAHSLLDEHDPVSAIQSFRKVAQRCPDCNRCRMLLGLALLDAGSWNSANREVMEAAKLAPAAGTTSEKVDSLLILAELENWKGEHAKAAGFLMEAKNLDPNNAFLLQELGRTLILQENWDAADDYLNKALAAGASKEALLLRARAMLEEGDAEAADAAMKEYVGTASLKSLPLSVRSLGSQIQMRMNLQTFAQGGSVVSEPLSILVQDVPELRGLEPDASQSQLAPILRQTGESVRAFFGNFQNTVSVEQIREERLGKGGKVKDSLDQRFRYLLVSHPGKQGLGLEEFRTDFRGDRSAPTGLSDGLMLSSGFATASLLFHPAYQPGSTFRYLGRQPVNGHPCYVVAFAQMPEKAQMVERFNATDGSVLVLLQGLAWIDAQSHKIIRLRTDLLKPQTKIRLQRQTTEITYDLVKFKRAASDMWLPREVALTVEWRGKTYRNLHEYSDFKLFSTETKDKVQQVDVPPDEPQHPQPL